MIMLADPNDGDDLLYDTYDPFEDTRRVEKIHRQRKGRIPVGASVSASRGAHRSRVSRRARPEQCAERFTGTHRRTIKSKRKDHTGQSLAALV